MPYRSAKVYNDGSHYIAIPQTDNLIKKKKRPTKTACTGTELQTSKNKTEKTATELLTPKERFEKKKSRKNRDIDTRTETGFQDGRTDKRVY